MPARRRPFPSIRLIGLAGALFGLAACQSSQPPTDWAKAMSPLPPVPGSVQDGAPGDRRAQGPFQPNAYLRLCHARPSNAPAADRARFIVDFDPLVIARERVVLATAPANDVCLSSGFGPRGGRLHKGIDLVARPAGYIYSAAPGIVREARWGEGFGWFVTLDHGHGVYTRYAHLEAFMDDIKPGTRLGFGQALGKMGRTGNATATHLHYEVLQGRWGRRGSFDLSPLDPLSLPGYDPLPAIAHNDPASQS